MDVKAIFGRMDSANRGGAAFASSPSARAVISLPPSPTGVSPILPKIGVCVEYEAYINGELDVRRGRNLRVGDRIEDQKSVLI